MKKLSLENIIVISVMASLSTVIYMIFPEIPLVPGVEYLKLDFSDIPAILTGIIINPIGGILVEVIKNIIHLSKTTSYAIGEIMNICMGSVIIFCLLKFDSLFAKVFHKEKLSAKTYYLSSIVTIIVAIIAGWILNAVFTPLFFLIAGIPITSETIISGVIGSTLLNAIKVGFNILPFYPVYISVKKYILKRKV